MYKDILRSAWQITWKHKYLWFFGIFATALSSAGAGAWNILVTNITRVFEQPQLFEDINTLYTSDTLSYVFSNVSNFLSHPTFNSFAGLIVPLALIAIGVWLSITSQGGLISATAILSDEKKTTIEQNFRAGRESFWRLFALFILSQLAIYGTWFILGFPLVAISITNGLPSLTTIFAIISFVIFVPLSVVVNFILIFASIYTVINKTPIIESAYQGWKFFRNHWLTSLEFALLLFLINIVVTLFFVFLLVMPLVIILLIQSSGSSYVLWSAVVTLIVLVAVGAVLTTYQFAATVVFVKKLSKEEASNGWVSKLLHKLFKMQKTI